MRAVEGYHPELRHLRQSQPTNGSASTSVDRAGH
jgi:hypothetical protein